MLAQILVYVIQTLCSLYALAMLLRFIFQMVRADFYNPISQAIVKITNPPLIPLRKVIPPVKGMDTSSLLLTLLIIFTQIELVYLIATHSLVNPITGLLWSLFGLVALLLNFYFIALIAMVIVSWVAPQGHNPAVMLLWQITEPICAPFRKLVPPMGGLDISVIFVFMVLSILRSIVLPHLAISIGIPGGLLLF